MGSFDRAGAPRIDERFGFPWTRQQDAAFLEGFADRRDPETQGSRVEPLAAGVKLWPCDDVLIGLVDTAAGRHHDAQAKIDLIMAHHHEDLDLPATVVVGTAALAVGPFCGGAVAQ